MSFIRRVVVLGAVVLLAILAPGLLLAQRWPFERNKVEPIGLPQAFREGYEAYQRRDYLGTIGPMQLAAASVPDLADYALFYLGAAQRGNGDLSNAADSFRRLTVDYPQSVLADAAGVAYATLELRLGRPDYALAAGTRVAESTTDPGAEQNARLIIAKALLATNDFSGAYKQAQMIREKFPWGSADAAARAIAHQILSAHPQAAPATPEYHRSEAALLIREAETSQALAQIRAGLEVAPSGALRSELTWLLAQASRGNPAAEKSALMHYLEIAPAGTHAAAATDAIAHLYWRAGDTASARIYFSRLVRQLPQSSYAPEAMFEIGRSYEDDGALDAARNEYLAVIRSYPGSEASAEARFRAPFMLYMQRRYHAAAAEFAAARAHAPSGERDTYTYWAARALERNGEAAEARRQLTGLAGSVDSNYYPVLAAIQVGQVPVVFPAAAVPELVDTLMPSANGIESFHMRRVLALRSLGLRGLEAPELRAMVRQAAANSELRDFVLAEMQASGAWHDAIQTATKWSESGVLSRLSAERIRYPRGYWEMVSSAASSNALDPYLVAALIRQESLYDPDARSVSDARGLMQLLPPTAERYAPAAGLAASPLDLYDPGVSVRLGTTYLRQLFVMFQGNMFKAVAAYNGGERAVAGWVAKYPGDDDQWVENIGFRETRDYVKKVIGGMREYRLLYQARSAASNSIPPPPSPG